MQPYLHTFDTQIKILGRLLDVIDHCMEHPSDSLLVTASQQRSAPVHEPEGIYLKVVEKAFMQDFCCLENI